MPAQKRQGQPDHKKHSERARVGVCDGKDERTQNNCPAQRHPTQQAGKDKAAEKYLLTKRRHNHSSQQSSIGGERRVFGLFQDHLVIGLKRQVQRIDYFLVESIGNQYREKEQYNPEESASNIKASKAQRLEC